MINNCFFIHTISLKGNYIPNIFKIFRSDILQCCSNLWHLIIWYKMKKNFQVAGVTNTKITSHKSLAAAVNKYKHQGRHKYAGRDWLGRRTHHLTRGLQWTRAGSRRWHRLKTRVSWQSFEPTHCRL